MSEEELLPFIADMSRRGAVSEVVSLDIPKSKGDDYFEWTIQKPARVFQIRIESLDFSKNGNLWIIQCLVKEVKVPVPGKLGHTILFWKNGVWVMPRDQIKIWVLSPVGIALRGALVFDWYTD